MKNNNPENQAIYDLMSVVNDKLSYADLETYASDPRYISKDKKLTSEEKKRLAEEIKESEDNLTLFSDHWGNIASAVAEEGFASAFTDYSNWDEVEDMEFHKLLKAFQKAKKKLERYLNTKPNYKYYDFDM